MNRRIDFIRIRTMAHQRTLGPAAALLALVVLLPLLLLAARNNPAAAASPSPELTAAEWAQMQSQIAPRADDPWSQTQKLTASDETANAEFGTSVAIDGDTAIVGAYFDDSNKGAAYVFTRTDGTWTQQQKLVSSDLAATDLLGSSVALKGDTAVIGAPGKLNGIGAVYVFTRTDGVWTEQAKLSLEVAARNTSFGISVALSGSTLAVGASNDDSSAGSVYVYVSDDGTTWTLQQKVVADAATPSVSLGGAVALEGDMLLAGAPFTSGSGGAVYAFTRTDGTWTQQQQLTAADTVAGDRFGHSVAMSGNLAVFGAFAKASATGAAYIFSHDGTSWTEAATLTASDGAQLSGFGEAVAIDGTTVVVGALFASKAYVYTRGNSCTWAEEQKLTAPDGTIDDQFGFGAAVNGTTVFVGATKHNGARGAVYVFGSAGGGGGEDCGGGGGDDAVPGAFVSAAAAGKIGRQLNYGPNDILRYDGTTWTKWFDAAAAGLTTPKQAKFNTNALWVESADPGAAVMAFAESGITLPGVAGKVNGTDLIRWDGSAFSRWFSGRAVGLDDLGTESIDGLHVLLSAPSWSEFSGQSCEAYLLISTVGLGNVPKPGNVKPKDKLAFSGEDVLGLCATRLGADAAGTWEMVMDGSEYDMKRNAITSIAAGTDGNALMLSSKVPYRIGRTTIKPYAVFQFDKTTETFSGPVFRASNVGMRRGAKIDGLNLILEDAR